MEDEVTSTIKLGRYRTFVLLVGTVLAFADPITDILALVEFYRADHKTWFSMGLVFVILPSLCFSVLYCLKMPKTDEKHLGLYSAELLICGCNPFAVAFTRLQAFILCAKNFKKLWNGDELDTDCNTEIKKLIYYEIWGGMFEAILESMPQFIIQLYAMIVQEEQIASIQTISLCVSFLSLTWTASVADEWRLLSLDDPSYSKKPVTIKVKVVLCVSQLFHLGGRLLAIVFFTVSFKWWLIAVVMIHTIIMFITRCWADCRRCGGGGCCDCSGCCSFLSNCMLLPVAACVYWIRDDGAAGTTVDETKESLKVIQLVSNVLFVIENLIMICVYYSTEEPHSWYSKPVLVCVCVFTILGAVMRVILYRFLL